MSRTPVPSSLARLLLLACGLLSILATPAMANSKKEQAKAAVAQAELDYKLARFREALDAYTHAYELFPAPALLFDIGQCHKNLKEYERAIFFFEGYLREEQSPSKRKLAQDLIAESRAELARTQAAAPAPDTAASTPPPAVAAIPRQTAAPPALSPPVAPQPPALVAAAPAPAADADDQRQHAPLTHRWWFWTVVGAGAAAAATGTFIYYRSGATTTVLPGGTLGTLDRR